MGSPVPGSGDEGRAGEGVVPIRQHWPLSLPPSCHLHCLVETGKGKGPGLGVASDSRANSATSRTPQGRCLASAFCDLFRKWVS